MAVTMRPAIALSQIAQSRVGPVRERTFTFGQDFSTLSVESRRGQESEAEGALIDGTEIDGTLPEGTLMEGTLIDGTFMEGTLMDGGL
jgi:hypothetical protein